ncbi:RagB/SusD family nutrient uptake outer membrane protein [Elizabethkingia bruuniana]|uniref:RagB/SusD family nutrient uptake outer membrane protein n=1 Tax=Elizabethkingia bruuniana TaxID=1756149 RepID=A0A7T7V2W1_9FLAO|nr:RagB/SusD family nutrient uptake outer membrane protein [Elizabethkingia bruuniana]KGO08209.1 carbohydrate-binding protein SusD [Elizabethkingia miricola]KUY26775.1 carbohydrate-binding protein SusD [Elizabethkingia bruuniana]QDZ63887.1 RagB/SusD family nutrient uptake outer membrane protein [Elizabethkingia bruuniana]QQN60708.1 RagB/SusD family nutrient uptake outer membrane protein [Elizabethkingia bruuniana]
MTKIKYTLFLAFAASVFISCESELETAPTNQANEEEVFKTADNAETVVNGAWAKFNDDGTTYANIGYSTVLRASDAMGSDVAVLTNKYGFNSAYAFTDLVNNTGSRTLFVWNLFYSAINNMNNVLSRIDNIEGSQEKKDQVKGQAKAFRAFCYLNLASFYQFSYQKDKTALTVPIYTQPATINSVGNKRASLEELYTLIKSDLLDAKNLLKSYKRNNKDKIDLSVVNGLLARTYLNTGEWLKAADAANTARTGYAFMPTEKYSEGFNDIGNSEWIWGHGQTQEQSSESYAFHYLDVSSSGSYYYSFMADPFFKDLFDTNDIRYQLFEWDGLKGREGLLRYKKFKFKPNLIADIVYMRSAEMYLIAAEGYARSGNASEAVANLNLLKAARKANLYNGSLNTEAVLKEVLIERRKELFGEGFSLSDIIRTQGKVVRNPYTTADGKPIKVKVTTPDGTVKEVDARGHSVFTFPDKTEFVPNSRYYIFPIPQKETESNPNL